MSLPPMSTASVEISKTLLLNSEKITAVESEEVPEWKDHITIRGLLVRVVLGIMFCIITHKLNLTDSEKIEEEDKFDSFALLKPILSNQTAISLLDNMTESCSNGSASSSSSFNSSFQDTEDDQTIARILAEEENSNLNKLGKRLSHLDSIPHTPRINGEIPDVNDATLDHERLSERLQTYGLAELQMEGDGNCQFRALADQLFRNPDYHKHVRKKVVKQLKQFRKLYEGYVPMKYRSYVRTMKKLGEWGDHVTLQAAADRFGAKICLVTSFRDTGYIEIMPKDKNPTRELWLSFWSEVHYNSLYANGDVPTRTPRKKYWLF